MSQNWTENVFQGDHVGQTDLQNMENNFGCLKSLFSGPSQPASMGACHPWFDTSQHVFKVRNDGDTAWWGLMHGDTSQKIWIYRNAAMNGWAVDSAVSDKVLALKGGSVYTMGGAAAGTWAQPNHTHPGPSHSHPLPMGVVAAGTAFCFKKTQTSGNFTSDTGISAGLGVVVQTRPALVSMAGGTETSGGGATANSYRPAASVGTLQYMDL